MGKPGEKMGHARGGVLNATARTPAALERARAAYVLREHVLRRVAAALCGAGVRAAAVKGAGLAREVYDPPWEREMVDIDLLVPEEQLARAVAALEGEGWVVRARGPERWLTAGVFHEVVVVASAGVATMAIELHTALDKVSARPIDVDEILGRSSPLGGLDGLLLPEREDHLLLVVVHFASSEFRHTQALVDLERLLAHGVDWDRVSRRASRWKLSTALWASLVLLVEAGSARVPPPVLERLRPRGVRRWALGRVYDLSRLPPSDEPLELGWRWLSRQAPLRDDSVAFALDVLRYAAARAVEKAAPR
jgi:hypothetical protein